MRPIPYLSYEDIKCLKQMLHPADILYTRVELIWLAMTDWMTYVSDCGDFLIILHHEVGAPLTRLNLDMHRRGYGIQRLSNSTWNVEALMELDGLFEYYPEEKTLEAILPLLNTEMAERLTGVSG